MHTYRLFRTKWRVTEDLKKREKLSGSSQLVSNPTARQAMPETEHKQKENVGVAVSFSLNFRRVCSLFL